MCVFMFERERKSEEKDVFCAHGSVLKISHTILAKQRESITTNLYVWPEAPRGQ